ncbi:MAG TPA: hypothetical protein VIK26_11085 [Clostridium sp.]
MKSETSKIYAIDVRLKYLKNDELLSIASVPFSDANYCNFIYTFINNDDFFTKSKERGLMREIRKQTTDYSKSVIQLTSYDEAPKCLYINNSCPLIEGMSSIKEYRFYNNTELLGGIGVFYCELKTGIKDSEAKYIAIEHIVMNRFNCSKTGLYSRFVIAIRCSDSETWELAVVPNPKVSLKNCRFSVSALCDVWLLVKSTNLQVDIPIKCTNVHEFVLRGYKKTAATELLKKLFNVSRN